MKKNEVRLHHSPTQNPPLASPSTNVENLALDLCDLVPHL